MRWKSSAPKRSEHGRCRDAAGRVSTEIAQIAIMTDSAEQLQRLYLAGFELQTFERYPKCIGVVRDGCVALLVPGMDGLQILGSPGWRMGEVMGVLTEREGRQVFQAKSEIAEATPEKLAILQKFHDDVAEVFRKKDDA